MSIRSVSGSTPIVTLYTTRYCPYCIHAKQLLEQKNVRYKEISVDQKPHLRQQMMEKSGRHTVPQIWINQQHIGGCDDLFALEHSGQLDQLIKVS